MSMPRVAATHTHVAVPGEALPVQCTADEGSTFVWGGSMRASVTGRVDTASDGISSLRGKRARGTVLGVGDVVVCRVTRINPRLANMDIICVGDTTLREPSVGLLRLQDVRPPDPSAEPIEMYRSFRPGDVVLASVISLGDARAYYLSTTAANHGVVIARTSDGVRMVPISWCEMECPETKVRERRKVAKPDTSGVTADNGSVDSGSNKKAR